MHTSTFPAGEGGTCSGTDEGAAACGGNASSVSFADSRVILKGTIESGPKGIKIKTLGKDGLSINKDNIDLRAIEQIVDSEQLNTIGVIMKYVENNLMGKDLTLIEIADKVIEDINDNLINIDRTKGGYGSLATVRKQELISAYNRFRKLRVKK